MRHHRRWLLVGAVFLVCGGTAVSRAMQVAAIRPPNIDEPAATARLPKQLSAARTPETTGAQRSAGEDVSPSVARFRDDADSDRLPTTLNTIRVRQPGDLVALEMIAQNRREPDEVRNEAMTAIQAADAGRTLSTCGAIATDTEETPRMRAFAVQHLGRLLSDGRLITTDLDRDFAALRSLAQDGEKRVRREAFAALAAVNDPSALDVIARGTLSGHNELDDLIIYHWASRGDVGRRAEVASRADDAREAVRIAAIYACGVLGDAATAERLASLTPVDERTRRAIAAAIDSISTRER